ncbi:MAG: GGDEF domain-containing protein, partial [Lachnospiraceae bacterium]|nr:GGDEF domain-containing protein [Lachnospiraceae bacterium]
MGENKIKKKRPVVGILTGSFNSDYPRTLIQEFDTALTDSDLDVDIRLYTGIEATLFFGNYSTFDQGFDKHWISIFEYSHFEDLDLLIVAYGNIMASHPHIDAETFLPRLPQVPTIIIGNDTVMPEGYYIMIDNYLGMKENVDHLIEVHGYKNIAFVSGPKGSPSADLRMEAYLDSLEEHGMEIRDNLIVYGNYSNNVDPLIEELFDRNVPIDAIVSSNDEMCNAIYRVAKRRGFKIGTDLAVVGFDDEEYAEEMDPPLTTVKQDYRLLAQGLVFMISNFASGRGISSLRIPASCVRRSSCGCSYETVSMKLENRLRENPDRYFTHDGLHHMQQRNMISALVLRSVLTESANRRAFFTKLAHQMQDIGAKSSYVLLLEQPVRVEEWEDFALPETMRLYMRQDGLQCQGYDAANAPVVEHRSVGKYFKRRRGVRMVSFLLFYDVYQYGVLAVEIPPDDVLFFYSMSLQLGSALRYMEMAEERERVNRLLEKQNDMLDYAASHDKLTGVYNRLGVMNRIPEFLTEHKDRKNFVMMVADLDHLKQI